MVKTDNTIFLYYYLFVLHISELMISPILLRKQVNNRKTHQSLPWILKPENIYQSMIAHV